MSEKYHAADAAHLDDFQLNEYLDGYLAPAETAAAAQHLAGCPSCVMRLESLQAVFRNLETLPDIPLARDLSSNVIATLQPDLKLSPPIKWGLLAQATLALIILSLTLPSLLKTWQPWLSDWPRGLDQQSANALLAWLTEWSTQLSDLQLAWARLIADWQPPTFLEATQIVVWPIFLTAILLFIVGNGLILRKVSRNGVR